MIKWNEVTWYSRIGALILFIGVLPALSFYIGDQFALVKQGLMTPVSNGTSSSTDPLGDDAVFADGSIPSTWAAANFSDPHSFKVALLSLQQDVLSGNDQAIESALADQVFWHGQMRTKQYIIDHFAEVKNQAFISVFKTINTREIFRRDQGAMIGNGDVWFRQESFRPLEIITINT